MHWIILIKRFITDEGEGEVVLLKGETVLVIGASSKRGHLLVEHKNKTLHVPYQYMELKSYNINVWKYYLFELNTIPNYHFYKSFKMDWIRYILFCVYL